MATLVYNNLPTRRPGRSFNAAFNELLREALPAATEPGKTFVPATDVLESKDGYELVLAVPGVTKDSLQLDVEEGKLTIRGERPAPAPDEAAPRFRRVETAYGTFARTFQLPDSVNAKAIGAELTDGLLRVTLPFDTEKVAKHHIEVR